MAATFNFSELVICKRSKPAPPTADAFCIAIDEVTQQRYLCKDQGKHSWLPLVEWMTQQLARRCGVLVPDCFAVELEAKPGSYLFGSKWEGGAEDYSPGIVSKVTNPTEFSKIFAFDLLVHNVDRHMNNYLYLQLAGDTVLKAMDHSRTWWFSGWPLPAPPPSAATATMSNFPLWTGQAGWDRTAADSVVNAWSGISAQDAADMVDSAPSCWIDPVLRQNLIAWWGSPTWTNRTSQIIGVLP